MAGMDPPSPGGRELEGGGLLLSCGGEDKKTPPPRPSPVEGEGEGALRSSMGRGTEFLSLPGGGGKSSQVFQGQNSFGRGKEFTGLQKEFTLDSSYWRNLSASVLAIPGWREELRPPATAREMSSIKVSISFGVTMS